MGESWGYAGYGRNDEQELTPMQESARRRRLEDAQRKRVEALHRGELAETYLALADRVAGYYGSADSEPARRAIKDWLLEQT